MSLPSAVAGPPHAPGSDSSHGGRVRYIGSKARVVDQIIDLVGTHDGGTFVDPFCGTGVVAEAAGRAGWPVRAGDLLTSAAVMTTARMLSSHDVPFKRFGGYSGVLAYLNSLDGEDGFFVREYTLAGEHERNYFTPENGSRIDAWRRHIRGLRQRRRINHLEHWLLLADLLRATNRVANIAGTYGCYLRGTCNAAWRSIELTPSRLKVHEIDFEVWVGDAAEVPVGEADTLYLDPPYTRRQYAAYYHIPETLANEDCPALIGKTGLRPWGDRASDYCYKSRAHAALSKLIAEAPARRVLLSYSDEGHVDLGILCEDLTQVGEVTLHSLSSIGRYRPNVAASRTRDEVTEFIVEVRR